MRRTSPGLPTYRRRAQRAGGARAMRRANAQLAALLLARTEQLSVLTRHLIAVSEDEKARLARELHDELGALLTVIDMDLQNVLQQLRAREPTLVRLLERARGQVLQTLALKRRIVDNLHPSMLDHLGLRAALQHYCHEFCSISALACRCELDPTADWLPPGAAMAVFRIVQEALTNVARHSGARRVVVRLRRGAAGLHLHVDDDGVGIADSALAAAQSYGLLGMRERALLLGASLCIARKADGQGTGIDVMIPMPERRAAAGSEQGGASTVRRRAADAGIRSSRSGSTRRPGAPGPGGPGS